MVVTLKQLMTADSAAGGVFYPVDDSGDPREFNEVIVFYEQGDKYRQTSVRAHVHQGGLAGRNERPGEGWANLDHRSGKLETETIIVDMPAGLVTIQEPQPPNRPDMVKIGSNYYYVLRVEGRDDDEISLIVSARKVERSRGSARA